MEVDDSNLRAECLSSSFPPEYLHIISQNDISIHGYLLNIDMLDDLLQRHKQHTMSVFYIKSKSTYHRRTNRIFSSNFLTNKLSTFRMKLKYETYRCRYGLCKATEQRDDNEAILDVNTATYLQSSVLRGCPAQLKVEEYIIFPELINEGSRQDKEAMKKLIHKSMTLNFKNMKTMQYIEVELPLINAHRNHTFTPQDIKIRRLTGLIKRKSRSDKGSRKDKIKTRYEVESVECKEDQIHFISTESLPEDELPPHKVVMANLIEADDQLLLLSVTATNKIVHVFSTIPGLHEAVRACLPDVDVRKINVMYDPASGKTNEVLLMQEDVDILKDAELMLIDRELFPHFANQLHKLRWVQITDAVYDEFLYEFKETAYPSYNITKSLDDDYIDSLVEYVVGWIIHEQRNLFSNRINRKAKKLGEREQFNSYKTLDKLTVTILGLGSVGRAVAKMMIKFRCKVCGFAKTDSPELSNLKNYSYSVDLPHLIEHSDVIVNTLPPTKHVNNLIDHDMLRVAKKHPLFINIGNSSIISEAGLLKAIYSEWISKAILDLQENDMIKKSSDLWTNSNVIITPSVSRTTRTTDIAQSFTHNWEQMNNSFIFSEDISLS